MMPRRACPNCETLVEIGVYTCPVCRHEFPSMLRRPGKAVKPGDTVTTNYSLKDEIGKLNKKLDEILKILKTK